MASRQYPFNIGSFGFSSDDDNAIVLGAPDDIVLMQFTGVQDKNGRDIYEGDILRITPKRYPRDFVMTRKVSFEHRAPACGFVLGDAENEYIEHFGRIMKDDDDDWNVEVIGNIYENPDLLKVATEINV